MKSLLKQHKELIHEQNMIIKEYRTLTLIPFSSDQSKLKKLSTKYLKLREDILDVEDQIGSIDEDMLNLIVEPIPDDIKNAIDLFSNDEWNNMKR